MAESRSTAGDVERSVVLPAGYGKAIRLQAGRRLRLVNLHGVQAVDLWAFVDGDPGEYLSMEHFRSVHSVVWATTATPLVSNARRAIVTIVEDTSSGRHDTLLCPCNEPLYRQLGAPAGHRSCADNLHEGLADLGLAVPFTPASLNLFMCVEVRADGSIDRRLPSSSPGSHLVLQAEVDVVLAFSCCPQDITPINGPERTPRDCRIDILAPPPEDAR
ncbi:urea carboxylase-associated family protein [Siculibacillus lacustris]|uniref:Urea carboxylase-associated family protein n=1 Tax=Siculibacillus lacustris TaxID=1549641 RepID=A0A4Q9VJ70_9HYPH|nr:urea carboxylase-associated family protein [Siculibacillus lacustris]TBW35357.1 urea carboxylase-associated family protein [Siculibacillus lacustris]